MNSIFQPIWLFLKENSVGALKVPAFFLFLKDHDLSFFKNSSDINDEDLFRFLFLELEEVIKSINIDKNLVSQDLLLDIFLQIIDYYGPVQKQIKNLHEQILKSPHLLKEYYFYGKRTARYLFLKCPIEKMVIPSQVIPFADKLNISSETDIPAFFHESAFSALCLYFLYSFQNDDSHDFEKTIVTISEVVHYIKLKTYA
jgi:hypothetical protein